MKVIDRLDKWLSLQTPYSRKEIKVLARAGKISLGSELLTNSAQKVEEGVTVTVEGEQILLKRYLYLMMNKPIGVISATTDPKHETAVDIVPVEWYRRDLFPAGRLDKDTEGFLLLTNDGQLAHKVTSPKHRVPKTYYAELSHSLDLEKVARSFAQGMELGEEHTSSAQLKVLCEEPFPKVELTIYEGVYHQVKRMFGAFGVDVTYLKRIKIGDLPLDIALNPGETRELTPEEATKVWQND